MVTLILVYVIFYPELRMEPKGQVEFRSFAQCEQVAREWLAHNNTITDEVTLPTAWCVKERRL